MKFKDAKKLLKRGKEVRRKAWGASCYIYLDEKDNKYKTQSGNEFVPNPMTECDNDWEDLESHIDRLCRQRDYFNRVLKDIFREEKMKFEEALKAMREGKAIKHKDRTYPLVMKENRICELYRTTDNDYYEPLDTMNTCNIMRDDWEVVDE